MYHYIYHHIILSIHSSINTFIYQYIHLSTYSTINIFNYQYIQLSTYSTINIFNCQHIQLSIHSSINTFIYQCIILFIYWSIINVHTGVLFLSLHSAKNPFIMIMTRYRYSFICVSYVLFWMALCLLLCFYNLSISSLKPELPFLCSFCLWFFMNYFFQHTLLHIQVY